MIAGPSLLRLLAVLLAIGAGLAGSALLASRAEQVLHQPVPVRAPAPRGLAGEGRRLPATHGHGATRSDQPADPPGPRLVRLTPSAARRSAATRPLAGAPHLPGHGARASLFGLRGAGLVVIVAAELVLAVVLVCVVLVVLSVRRLRLRTRREYRLYELHLSTHDEAKPQDLEDLLEQVANIVRVFPAERPRHGQPYVALELICNRTGEGMEWSINLRCQPQVVRALDGAISAAYLDVRVGHVHAEAPTPRPGAMREPGHVMRFRKQRSFIYPLIAAGERLGSPPLEQIARAQVQLGQPSVVRFALTPTPTWFERLARRHHQRRERQLAGDGEPGRAGRGALFSTLHRSELTNALGAQNRSLFWLEAVVAADSARACQTIAAAVQSRRGENRLHRRIMVARQGLYRRRFARALGPLIPSLRSLVSAAEAAHLLALPSARMKGVPTRRLTVPRIPAAPQAGRGSRQLAGPPDPPRSTAATATHPR